MNKNDYYYFPGIVTIPVSMYQTVVSNFATNIIMPQILELHNFLRKIEDAAECHKLQSAATFKMPQISMFHFFLLFPTFIPTFLIFEVLVFSYFFTHSCAGQPVMIYNEIVTRYECATIRFDVYLPGMVTIPVSMYQTVVSNVNPYQSIQVAMASSNQQQIGEVPDATHAVEIMTVEPTSVT